MVVKDGVDFDSLDGEPVHLIFLIAAPNTEDNIHLDVLSKLSVLLMDEQFTADLLNAKSVDEFLEIVDKADDEKSDIDERLADTGEAEGAQAKLLAVTACRQVLRIRIWRQKALRRLQRQRIVSSRLRQEDPVVQRT